MTLNTPTDTISGNNAAKPSLKTYERGPKNTAEPADSLVIFAHGLGANGMDLIDITDYWAEKLPRTLFLSPDAPQPCDMAPPEFASQSRQWFSLQDRSIEAIQSQLETAEIIFRDYILAQMAAYNLPANRIALVGFSQGTMLSLYTAMRFAAPFAGVVGYSGALIGEDLLPNPTKFPVFLRHGEQDQIVPPAAFIHAFEQFKAKGYDVTGETVPGLEHGIDDMGFERAGEFLAKVFGADK